MQSSDERQPKQNIRFCRVKAGISDHYGYFLSKGKWDERKVSQKQQTEVLRKASELALAKHEPIYLSR